MSDSEQTGREMLEEPSDRRRRTYFDRPQLPSRWPDDISLSDTSPEPAGLLNDVARQSAAVFSHVAKQAAS
jgi:hypothetical protein